MLLSGEHYKVWAPIILKSKSVNPRNLNRWVYDVEGNLNRYFIKDSTVIQLSGHDDFSSPLKWKIDDSKKALIISYAEHSESEQSEILYLDSLWFIDKTKSGINVFKVDTVDYTTKIDTPAYISPL